MARAILNTFVSVVWLSMSFQVPSQHTMTRFMAPPPSDDSLLNEEVAPSKIPPHRDYPAVLAVGLDRPDGREHADLNRPFGVERIDDARFRDRRAPGGKCRVAGRHRHRGEILKHQHDLRRELEPDREVSVPLVRRALRADPVGDFGVEEAGNRAEAGNPTKAGD